MRKEKAKRVNTSITYNVEKKLLLRMVGKIPGFITPDSLTILGLISALLIGACFYLSRYNKYWLLGSVLFFIVHWFADSLDGTLARVRKIERERYGYFVDHISDMFATILIMVGLGVSPLMSIFLALIIIIAYFLASINTYLAAYTQGVFQYSIGRIGPTEIRIFLIILTLLSIPTYPAYVTFGRISITLFNLFAIVSILILFALTLQAIIKNLVFLNKIDKSKMNPMTIQEYLEKTGFMLKLKQRWNHEFLKKRKPAVHNSVATPKK